MKIRQLGIEGAWEITPDLHRDERGLFLEWYQHDQLQQATGRRLPIAQANLSVSRAGVVRGIHFADVPPGQSKYVSCLSGEAWDVVVDLRVGSPTFGRWESVLLNPQERRTLYLAEGLGHAFCALSDNTTVAYFCSTPYNPQREHAIHPDDPDLAITWPVRGRVLSERDLASPSLQDALSAGTLPRHTPKPQPR